MSTDSKRTANADDRVTGVTDEEVVTEFVRSAKGLCDVLECTTANGNEFQYFPYMPTSVRGTIWLEYTDSTDTTQIVTEERVRNVCLVCLPDIVRIGQPNSAFGPGDDDD